MFAVMMLHVTARKAEKRVDKPSCVQYKIYNYGDLVHVAPLYLT